MKASEIKEAEKYLRDGDLEGALNYLMSSDVGRINKIRLSSVQFRLGSLKAEMSKGVLTNEEYLRLLNGIAASTHDLIYSKSFGVVMALKRYERFALFVLVTALVIGYIAIRNQNTDFFSNRSNYNVMICPFFKTHTVDIEKPILDRLNQFSSDKGLDKIFECRIAKRLKSTISSYFEASSEGKIVGASFVIFGSTLPKQDSIFVNLRYQSLVLDSLRSKSNDSNFSIRYLDDIYRGSITGGIEESILKTIYLIDINRLADSSASANAVIEAGLKHEPLKIKAFLLSLKGCLAIRHEYYEQAYTDLLMSTSLDSSNYTVYNNLGVITLLHRDDKSLLIYFFTKAYELSGDPVVLKNLEAAKSFLSSIKEPEKDTPSIMKAIAGAPVPPIFSPRVPDKSKAPSFYDKGSNTYKAGNYTDAIIQLSEAIFHDPENGSYYFLRGMAYKNIGKKPNAKNDINISLSKNYKNFNSYYARSKIYKDENKVDSAIIDLETAISFCNASNKVNPTMELADLYLKKYKAESAISKLSELINAGYGTEAVYYKRALVYDKMGKYELAVKDLDEAIAKNPGNADLYLDRSGIKSKLHLEKESSDDFNKWNALKNKKQ